MNVDVFLNVIEIGEVRLGEIILMISSGRAEVSAHRSFRWTTRFLPDLESCTMRV